MAQEQDKKGPGRPKVHVFDYEQIVRMAELQCSRKEIAHILGCSDDTVKRDPKALDAIEMGKAHGKMKLRRAMFRNACENNSAPVQIFLAKNLLGMSDDGMRNDESNVPLPWNEAKEEKNATDETTTDDSEQQEQV
jgi:hypothetical protein